MAAKNIMIVGVGGQGTLLTSRILGGLATAGGYDVKLSEVHGMAQRGGSVVTFVRYGEKVAEPIVEEGQADVLIAFERLEALRYAHFLKCDGEFLIVLNAPFKCAQMELALTLHKKLLQLLALFDNPCRIFFMHSGEDGR